MYGWELQVFLEISRKFARRETEYWGGSMGMEYHAGFKISHILQVLGKRHK